MAQVMSTSESLLDTDGDDLIGETEARPLRVPCAHPGGFGLGVEGVWAGFLGGFGLGYLGFLGWGFGGFGLGF